MSHLAAFLASRSEDTGRAAPLAAALGAATQTVPLAAGGLALTAGAQLAQAGGLSVLLTGEAQLAGNTATEANSALAIAQAWLTAGEATLSGLSGHWALIVVDERGAQPELIAATDRLGTVPLFWCTRPGGAGVSTRIEPLRAALGPFALDPQAVFDYLYFHMIPAPASIWRECRRLLPGSLLRWRGGTAVTETWWAPRYEEDRPADFAALKQEFVELLQDSVRPWAKQSGVGAFLSGGTDSSTVSGMLTRVGGRPASTWSIGFDAQGYDEMAYARIAASHFGTDPHEYYVSPADVVEALPRVAHFYEQPFGNASAIPTYWCARRAREAGLATLLAGDGGDELFGGNERYSAQEVFALYERVPGVVRAGMIEPLLAASGALGLSQVTPVRKASSYVAQARTPMPERTQSYNLLTRLGLTEVLTPDFLAAIDPREPVALLKQSYDGALASSQVNRMMALDLRFTLADSDLPKVSGMGELAGIKVAYPLMSDALLDFSLKLPPSYKLRGRQLRWFFKQALADFLPPQIITKTKHGFGLPVGAWLDGHAPLRTMAAESLASLKDQGMVRPEFLDRMAHQPLGQHAGYYGTMLWVLMMLGMWSERSCHSD
ncbi:MAG: asparagine synthase-related protein [Burkholderiaceae bacterium]